MERLLSNLMFIFPVMFYYLLESMLVGVFVYALWKLILSGAFNIHLNYLEIISIYWVIKMFSFNVFSLAAVASQQQIVENNEEEIENE